MMIEVKFGSMPYVAKAVVICTNLSPDQMMDGILRCHVEAFKARFSENEFQMSSKEQRYDLCVWFCKCMVKIYGGVMPDIPPEPRHWYNQSELQIMQLDFEAKMKQQNEDAIAACMYDSEEDVDHFSSDESSDIEPSEEYMAMYDAAQNIYH